MRRRHGGNASALPVTLVAIEQVAELGRGGHPVDEPQQLGVLLAEHRVEAGRLAERALDGHGKPARAVRAARGGGRRVPEPGRSRARDQRVERQHALVLRLQSVERIDLLAHDDRVGGERVKVTHPAAAAAGVGEHVRQRLEVDVGGGHVFGVTRPGKGPVGRQFGGGSRRHAWTSLFLRLRFRWFPGGGRAGVARTAGLRLRAGDPVDRLDGGEPLGFQVLHRGEGGTARREQRHRPGIEHEARDPPAVGPVQHQFGVPPVGGRQALQGPLHPGIAMDALLGFQEFDRFVLLGEEDHPVRVLPGRSRGGVRVVVVDALRARDERAAGTSWRVWPPLRGTPGCPRPRAGPTPRRSRSPSPGCGARGTSVASRGRRRASERRPGRRRGP